ncbi:streptophobe family protein [Streptomyces sp. NPDC021080]|uniref:streptophobe family protein n=1 Tax=Streptomyces sp. NPDC021080 TaxID=3365110 RepID=UPI0037A67547
MSIGTTHHGGGTGSVPWGDVLLSAIASVSWALIGMAGTAALGLHLLGADAAASLGPMTAAVVALGAGGSVTPSGNVSAFGLQGAQAHTAIQITPLGVSLVGALLLSWFFLRSLRGAGVAVTPAELLARAGAVVGLFVATLGGLAWAGHDVITIDGDKLGLGKGTGGGGGLGSITDKLPGGLGDLGGLLPDKIGNLVKAKAAVGFSVDTVPTLLGGAAWAASVLLIALLASRRTPLPHGWDAVHRAVRPAVSSLVAVLLVAVLAGFAAAAYASVGDAHPKRIAGAALLGAPNGVWLAVPLGLFVPWDGKATGELAKLLPDPLDKLLTVDASRPVTLGRLAELDGRVWLLALAAALMMLYAGVLTAARTPFVRGGSAAAGGVPGAPDVRGDSALRFAGRCALRLGVVTALALPLLAWLTEVSVDASLSVLGFDAFGAGIELRGRLGVALVLGALWGVGAGGVGALLAWVCGAAGVRVAGAGRVGVGGAGVGAAGVARGDVRGSGPGAHVGVGAGDGGAGDGGAAGPYRPRGSYRAPNPDTNPYLKVPDEVREPEDRRAGPGGARPGAPGDVYGAPTMVGPIGPSSKRRPDGPPPLPPPPPPVPPSPGEGPPSPRRPRR